MATIYDLRFAEEGLVDPPELWRRKRFGRRKVFGGSYIGRVVQQMITEENGVDGVETKHPWIG